MRQLSGRTHFVKRCIGMVFALCVLATLLWLLLMFADYNRYRVRRDSSQEIHQYLTLIRETPASLLETGLFPITADGFFVIGTSLMLSDAVIDLA